jgi:hypothetical protein
MATVVAVAALFAGAVWLVPGNSGTPAAGPPTPAPATTTARNPVPATPDDLTARFKVVLGDTATVDVTQKHTFSGGPVSSGNNTPPSGNNAPPGSVVLVPETVNPNYPTHALVGGTLTAAGVKGSFSLVIHPGGDSGPGTWCTNAQPADCVVSTLPDGSQLATQTVRMAPGAVSHMACLKRPDGTMIRVQVGNQEDPAGAVPGTPGGLFYAPQPPLTLEQLKAIVTSDKW